MARGDRSGESLDEAPTDEDRSTGRDDSPRGWYRLSRDRVRSCQGWDGDESPGRIESDDESRLGRGSTPRSGDSSFKSPRSLQDPEVGHVLKMEVGDLIVEVKEGEYVADLERRPGRGARGTRGPGRGARGVRGPGRGAWGRGGHPVEIPWEWMDTKCPDNKPASFAFSGDLPGPKGEARGVTDPLDCCHLFIPEVFYSELLCQTNLYLQQVTTSQSSSYSINPIIIMDEFMGLIGLVFAIGITCLLSYSDY